MLGCWADVDGCVDGRISPGLLQLPDQCSATSYLIVAAASASGRPVYRADRLQDDVGHHVDEQRIVVDRLGSHHREADLVAHSAASWSRS